MASSVALSLIIRTVDQSTAKIQAINARLAVLTKPIKDSNKAFGELRDHLGLLGLDAVKDGFSGVGREVGNLIGKVAMVGGVIAGAAVTAAIELKAMVEQFATLGHTAQRAGVEVDFLAGLRYAGEEAGLSIEQVDGAITTLTQNLGQMKSGTGRAFKFITEHVSGAFAQQLIHTHSTAEAVGLIADALDKVPDAARRAALAQKLLGDPALVQMLMHGSAAIQEQMVAHHRLAGSQEEAVKSSLAVEKSMVDMRAATDGVKAALVTGLSPAMRVIVEDMTRWLVGHRADIQQWADDIGKKLPGAVDDVVNSIKGAVSWVRGFVDDIGGWKVAVEGVVAVMVGPLALAIAGLGVALLATPFGQVLLLMTPIVAAIAAMVSQTEAFEAVAERLGFVKKKKTPEQDFKERQDEMMADGRRAAQSEARAKAALDEDPVVQKARLLRDQSDAFLSIPEPVSQHEKKMAALRAQIDAFNAQHPGPQEAKIKIEISGAPKGTRATIDPGSTADVDLSVGHQMGAGQ